LVHSTDRESNRIEKIEHLSYLLSSGGQNWVKPPNKLLWKKQKLYRITDDGKVEKTRKVIGYNKKYKTYFRKESE